MTRARGGAQRVRSLAATVHEERVLALRRGRVLGADLRVLALAADGASRHRVLALGRRACEIRDVVRVAERVGPLHGVERLRQAAAPALDLPLELDGAERRADAARLAREVGAVDAREEERAEPAGRDRMPGCCCGG